MIVNTASSRSPIQLQNHRQPQVVRALRWFWKFSNFYGEYAVRSPQARQQWLAEQRTKCDR